MLNVIGRGFANVTRFSGRDARRQFWPYCGVVFALFLVVGWAVLIPTMLPAFGASSPSVTAFQDRVSHFVLIDMLMFCVFVLLLASAVARRLHDTGRSALWGLMPLPFVAYSGTMFSSIFSQIATNGQPKMGLFLSVFVSNLLYMAVLVTLIVFLTRPSTPTSNRYG